MEQSTSSLVSLPAELLHRIFEHLQNPDILSARCTCTTLADVGKRYILEEVVGVYKREWLQRLSDVSEDPYFSKRIKAFYFQADAYGSLLPFEKWKKECKSFRETKSVCDALKDRDDPDPAAPWEGRKMRAAARAVKKHMSAEEDVRSHSQLRHAYSRYTATVADQERMRAEGFDQACMRTLFQQCPNLDKVTVYCGSGSKSHFDLAKRAFADCVLNPAQDIHEEGVDQLWSLIKALNAADKSLRSLTIDELSYGVFDYHLAETGSCAICILSDLASPAAWTMLSMTKRLLSVLQTTQETGLAMEL